MTDQSRIFGKLRRRILGDRVSFSGAHVPHGCPPTLIMVREGDEWRTAMVTPAGELGRFTSKELRDYANRCLRSAWLMDHPGECPIENYG
jgi:hypothetical protein